MTGNQDRVGLRLRHARRDRADAAARHELHADRRIGIDLLEVVDELREILDRVDVVMRRRADEHDARRRMPQFRDQGADLEAGQLATFARLGALRDLDLDFPAVVQVFRGHAEATRRDLLDRRRGIVPVRPGFGAHRILAALAAVGARADPVHRDRKRLVRLGAERAQRDAGRHQPLADLGDAFDLVDRDRLAEIEAEVEQVAQRDRR